MEVRRIEIHHFRSIRHLVLEASPLMVLLGPNNHGKSNVLGALDFLLSPSFKVTPEDFFFFRPPDDPEIWVEVTFVDLTEQEQRTFRKYLQADGSVTVRRRAWIQEGGAIETKHQGYVEIPDEWWLQESALDRLNTLDLVRAEMAEVPQLQALVEGGGRITKARLVEFQQQYIREHRAELALRLTLEEAPLLGTKNVGAGVLPDFYLIPAVRDLSDETKVKGTTPFGRLLQRTIAEMADRDPRFREVRTQIETLVQQLNDRAEEEGEPSYLGRLERDIANELGDWGVEVAIQVIPLEMERLFELGTALHIDDGIETLADRKGHGLQRALIFALIKAWAAALRRPDHDDEGPRARKASESLVFAFEEPELFLHPHAQRALSRSLKEVATTPEHQVLICTHSTHFVDLDEYRSVVIVSKPSPEEGSTARQCTVDLFEGEAEKERKDRFHMAAWINPDRAELFFARRVVLVEGETEQSFLPFLADQLGCLDHTVSVIDCGSKHNLPLYLRILNAFRLSYVVIHDEDPLPDAIPDTWSADKLRSKRDTFELNQRIRELVDPDFGRVEVMSPHFEGQAGISRSQADRKGKAIAALEHYARLPTAEVSDRIAEVVRLAYA